MEAKLVKVTPHIAAEWLKKNIENRALRRSYVEGLKLAFMRGEYITSSDAIGFNTDGEMTNGQHRCTAISEMPSNFVAEMVVVRGLAVDSFKVTDTGLRRSPGDVLRISNGLAAAARFMATIVETQKSGITPQLLLPYVAAIEPTYQRIIDYAPTITKTWSSAAVRAAAIARMMGDGDADYVLLSYHALNHADYDSMSRIVQTLHKQQAKGLVRQGGVDLFLRAHRAFDFRSQSMDRIQVNDHSARIVLMREFITTKILGQKKAADKAAANKRNGRNSTAPAARLNARAVTV